MKCGVQWPNHSRFGENDTCLGDDGPLLLWNVVLVDINVVSIGIQVVIEYQWSVHEGTRIDKTTSFLDLHLLHIEHKTPIEDMESHCTLATEQYDLIVSDLMSQAHVGRNPLRLVNFWSSNFFPGIPRDIVDFNSVHNLLLVNPPTKSENVVVLESAERSSSSRNLHLCNDFPLILLGVIHLTVSVNSVSHESTHNIYEVLYGADRMISVGIVHVSNLIQDSK